MPKVTSFMLCSILYWAMRCGEGANLELQHTLNQNMHIVSRLEKGLHRHLMVPEHLSMVSSAAGSFTTLQDPQTGEKPA